MRYGPSPTRKRPNDRGSSSRDPTTSRECEGAGQALRDQPHHGAEVAQARDHGRRDDGPRRYAPACSRPRRRRSSSRSAATRCCRPTTASTPCSLRSHTSPARPCTDACSGTRSATTRPLVSLKVVLRHLINLSAPSFRRMWFSNCSGASPLVSMKLAKTRCTCSRSRNGTHVSNQFFPMSSADG